MRNQRPWTDEETAAVKRLWPTHTALEIAAILGRTRGAIVGKAHRTYGKKPKLAPAPKPYRRPDFIVPLLVAAPARVVDDFHGQCRIEGCPGTAARPYPECRACRDAGRRAA